MARVAPHVTAIPLGRSSPTASSNQPGRQGWKQPAAVARRHRPYLVLLPVGFAMPLPLPVARCALTAPFHPYPRAIRRIVASTSRRKGTHREGGFLSVALSLGSPPPDVIRHRV